MLSIPVATEDNPISMCAFCSDSHAGVKWTVHESNKWKYPYGAYSLDISFQCSNTQRIVSFEHINCNVITTYLLLIVQLEHS